MQKNLEIFIGLCYSLLMKLTMTAKARQQLEIIRKTPSIANGFILGDEIGKNRIIESFFPVNFSENQLDIVCRDFFMLYREKLCGGFFNQTEPILSEWFLEDIIMTFSPGTSAPGVFIYDFGKKLISLDDTLMGEFREAADPAAQCAEGGKR